MGQLIRVGFVLWAVAATVKLSGVAELVATDQPGRIATMVAYAFIVMVSLGFSQPRIVVHYKEPQ